LKRVFLCLGLLAVVAPAACSRSGKSIEQPKGLTVAAAANLTDVFADIGSRFTAETNIPVVFSFGATADLAKQIENGAPFDVFASADVEHVEQLESKGLLTPNSRVLYARGKLVMWVPSGSKLQASRIQDITEKSFERISIAKPDVAPYGHAAVETLRALSIWDQIESRVIYAQNVSQAKQYAATGNAEVAFIPLALVKSGEGTYVEVDEALHAPIDQAIGIVKDSAQQDAARKFVDFLLSDEGQNILLKRGYSRPSPK
jgi:molybdate transport system substrate-binding protein